MYSVNDHSMILIGAAATKTTANYPENMNTGEIGIFKPGGTRYTEATASADAEFIICLKTTDGRIIKSPVLKKSMVTSAHLKAGAARTEQLDYVGYNGTSGSITATNDEFYRIAINMIEGYANNDHGTTFIKHAIYKADSATTQAEIATGLAKSGNDNFSREKKNSSGVAPIVFRAICDTALDTAYDMTNTVTVTKNSKVISVATNLTYNGAGGTLAVGDYIRMADSDTAPAVTSNVYRVVSISGLYVTLDRPYIGASGTLTDANDSTQVIPAATAVAANWGVSLTAQTLDFTVGKLHDKQVKFITALESGFGSSDVVTKSTASSPGIGHYNQIAQMEWFMRGANGELYRKGEPMLFSQTAQASDSNDPYDLIEFKYKTTGTGLIDSPELPASILLAFPATAPNYAIAGTADDITDVLEVLLAGVPCWNASLNGGALTTGSLAIS